MERNPVVAGIFYESKPERLRQVITDFWPQPQPAGIEAVGAMVPHAGYIYSGRTAAAVYSRLLPAEVYFLLGPNHTGRGCAVAVSGARTWKTPLGAVRVANDIARGLVANFQAAAFDDEAHETEHALEVQLPFIQFSAPNAAIIPITLGTYDIGVLRKLGEAVAAAIRNSGKKCLVLASSDMNHFDDLARTKSQDQVALNRVLAMNPEDLLAVVERYGISMCGAAPTAAMLFAAKALGAGSAELVHYATSAEQSGDEDRVVGYAGVIVKK